MIAEIGNFSLSMALAVALVQFALPIIGFKKKINSLFVATFACNYLQTSLLIISFLCLTQSFLNNDFSVLYVASHSNTLLPLIYKISAVWSAHEGSLLLWSLVLALWTSAVAICSKKMPLEITALILSIMGAISIGFLLFILFTSNPFIRIFPVPLEGSDLNPLLQDFGLAIHPPLLYLGYVGFSVAFSFAIAALIHGKMDREWARWLRPWTNLAWAFLTVGIVLGSWWAYYELGWGGWWFWDPVENASFMPWLVGTALVHSLAVTEKRGAFASWTLLLSISAFSLSLLGTFLVRSGVLTSVHSFASDPTRGLFILCFLIVVIGSSLTIYAFRAHKIRIDSDNIEPVSKESALLINNILLYVAMLSILLGTLYPLFIDALGLGKLSVGPPYFNKVFSPIMLLVYFFAGIGIFLRWGNDQLPRLKKTLCLMAAISIVLAVSISMMYDIKLYTIIGLFFGFWIISSSLIQWCQYWVKKSNPIQKIKSIPASIYGMIIAHIGFGLAVIGVTLTSFYSIEDDIRLSKGETYQINDIEFKFDDIYNVKGPNYQSIMGEFSVTQGDYQISLKPEKRTYFSQRNPMTEAAIDPKLHRDIYIALGNEFEDKSWSVRIYYKPFIRFIWLGGLLIALGGIMAIFDRKYRRKTPEVQSVS